MIGELLSALGQVIVPIIIFLAVVTIVAVQFLREKNTLDTQQEKHYCYSHKIEFDTYREFRWHCLREHPNDPPPAELEKYRTH